MQYSIYHIRRLNAYKISFLRLSRHMYFPPKRDVVYSDVKKLRHWCPAVMQRSQENWESARRISVVVYDLYSRSYFTPGSHVM